MSKELDELITIMESVRKRIANKEKRTLQEEDALKYLDLKLDKAFEFKAGDKSCQT